MSSVPEFPFFKPVELPDKPVIDGILRGYRPLTSELTFTNLFIWRKHFDFRWSVHRDWLFIAGREDVCPRFAVGPIGPPGRAEAARLLLEWLREDAGDSEPCIERADESLALEVSGEPGFLVEETRDHFDYVYLTRDLIDLAGGAYRAKRNHINQFHRAVSSYLYEELEERHIEECLALQERWCLLRRCEEDLNLQGEWEATKEILMHHRSLGVSGAVIVIDSGVKGFTLGESLGGDMAVIHIEKADPEIPGLYQFINQQFCARRWSGVKFVNREQDLGIRGLRDAKLSYGPDHFVKKYRIMLKG
ncbi:MAG TPA: phosphatidylglycerol lysyltransferase domain-containing protein [Syntrophorhabdaceae bacterium]|nr:phosphatidylglycerol lysyltransferase domain-containing protein [Syntrophorhabdaceae bacterium]